MHRNTFTFFLSLWSEGWRPRMLSLVHSKVSGGHIFHLTPKIPCEGNGHQSLNSGINIECPTRSHVEKVQASILTNPCNNFDKANNSNNTSFSDLVTRQGDDRTWVRWKLFGEDQYRKYIPNSCFWEFWTAPKKQPWREGGLFPPTPTKFHLADWQTKQDKLFISNDIFISAKYSNYTFSNSCMKHKIYEDDIADNDMHTRPDYQYIGLSRTDGSIRETNISPFWDTFRCSRRKTPSKSIYFAL